MFTNRIEIENPGGLYGRMTLDQLGKFSADTRNPYISNALEILGVTENRYRGIPTVISLMNEYGLTEPIFENERGIFRVTLYNETKQDISKYSDEILEILRFCSEAKSREEIKNLFSGRMTIAYVMAKYVLPMLNEGLLKYTIPERPKSKNQKFISTKTI